MQTTPEAESFYYVKSGIRILKKYWYVFVISVLICLAITVVINWYMPAIYEVSSVILIEESQNNKAAPSEEFMKSFAIFSSVSNIQQEMLKMKSTELINKSLIKINAEVSYYLKRGIKIKELYKDSPFRVEFDKKSFQPMNIKFQINNKGGNKFELFVEQEDQQVQLYNFEKRITNYISSFPYNKIASYGDTIKSDIMSFRVVVDNNKLANYPSGSNFYFVFNDLNSLTYNYQKAIEIEQVAKDVLATKISLKVSNPQEGIDFVNALTTAYLERNIEKKNVIAENTIKYLDGQLNIIEDSLKLTEGSLQNFRATNKVMNIESKANQTFAEAHDLENQRAELQARIKYYNYISNNLEKDQSGSSLLVPSSMGLNDNVLTGLIDDYIKLNTERNTLIQNKQSQSPYFNTLTIKINNQKNTLSENIKYLINTNNLLLNSIESRLGKENANINALTGTERKLVGIERKYKLNDENYNYLLKKKAEAQVAKASNIPDNDIIEPAKLTQQNPVSPNKTLNLAIALLVGLFIPFIGFGAKSVMDNTVLNEQMMQSITQLPSIGRVYHNKNKKQQSPILIEAPRSAISESLRTVRTNIEYFLQGKRNQIILVTSTMAGEGKSFNSLNIAISLSMLNRKTVLVDFDIRKPNLYQTLNVENTLGISSLLSGQATLKDVLVSTSIPNLDFITAGSVSHNPAELIGSEKTEILLNELKEKYDYIIIDTPPVGLVTEGFLLMKYADLKIFVVRQKYTPKKQLVDLLKDIGNKDVKNLHWLLNDVDFKDSVYGKENAYYSNS